MGFLRPQQGRNGFYHASEALKIHKATRDSEVLFRKSVDNAFLFIK